MTPLYKFLNSTNESITLDLLKLANRLKDTASVFPVLLDIKIVCYLALKGIKGDKDRLVDHSWIFKSKVYCRCTSADDATSPADATSTADAITAVDSTASYQENMDI